MTRFNGCSADAILPMYSTPTGFLILHLQSPHDKVDVYTAMQVVPRSCYKVTLHCSFLVRALLPSSHTVGRSLLAGVIFTSNRYFTALSSRWSFFARDLVI